MILYQSDWDLYPDAIADELTSNRSFVKMAKLYKAFGIKNHSFMLALHDKSLQGVNPHDYDNLTIEQMLAIGVECKVNPWYYFREVGRAQPIAGGDPVPHEANRGNIAFYWSFFNHVMVIRIQLRQTGKSFDSDDLATYLLNIGCTDTQINLLTKDDRLRTENLDRLKNMIRGLPPYLCQLQKSDVANTEEIRFSVNNNKFIGHVPQASPKAALSKARGLVSPIFFVDEAPFQANIEISLPAALSAGGAARDMAIANGTHYGTVLTTTAGKIDDKDGRYVYKKLKEAAIWSENLFDCKDVLQLEDVIRKASRSSIEENKLDDIPNGRSEVRLNLTFNHRQLGRTDSWLMQKLAESMSSGDAADRDYFNRWTSGSQKSPFNSEITTRIKKSELSEYYSEITKNNYTVRWMIPREKIDSVLKNPNNHFILSVDPSDAGGGDDLSMTLINIKDGGIVAAANLNELNLITFANWLAEWFINYPNITGIIERRSSGAAIIDMLLLILPSRGIDPFKRLFNWVVNNKTENPHTFNDCAQAASRKRLEIYIQNKRSFGFATSGSGETSRSELYSGVLNNAVKRAGDKIRDPLTIEQILALEERNNRIDHPVGGHDDMVISWLLGMWLLSRGKNLDYYGIDSRLIMSEANERVYLTPAQEYNHTVQLKLRADMEDTADKLSKEKNEFIIERLEQRLRLLNRSVILENDEHFSVDALIDTLRSERRSRLKENKSSFYSYRGDEQSPNPMYDHLNVQQRGLYQAN